MGEKDDSNWGGWVILIIIIWSIFFSGGSSSNSSYSEDGYEYEYEEEVLTSDNWECTDDCSGHEAGYEWAADNGISDSDDCGGNSNSFIEGCEDWANEQQMEEEEYYYEEEEYDYY